jgi:hypothetical protein
MSPGNEPDGCYILSDSEKNENPEHGTGSLDLEGNSACEEPGNTPTKNNKADITIDDITPRKQAKYQTPKGKKKDRIHAFVCVFLFFLRTFFLPFGD